MPEILQVDRTPPKQKLGVHLAIEAIAKLGRPCPVPATPGQLTVSLIVNGVEVPFADTMQDFYERCIQRVDRAAAALVYNAVQLKGLDEYQQLIREFDWKIRDKLKEVFGVEPPARDD